MAHFVDEATIHVIGGNGGDGCLSFRREKFVPRGGPDGGDGGNGGDVIMEADPNLSTLMELVSRETYRAGNGAHGTSKNRHGASGVDVVILVPVGTIVKDVETDLVLKDLGEPGQRIVVARGGKGGRGNACFATAVNQAPRHYEEGEESEQRRLALELKLVADVGLIGEPNAGKSTLLSRISAAHPKIAPYPFTTLQPELGIVDVDGYRTITVADLPGLIKDAHCGKGLGDEFLRHIERTRILVHVLDAASTDGADPVATYREIRRELTLYSESLGAKPEIVAANKMDLPDAEEGLGRLQEALDVEVMPISAVTGQGVRDLVAQMLRLLDETTAQERQGQPAPEL